MLTLTREAAEAIKTIAEVQPKMPGDCGLRMTVKPMRPPGRPRFQRGRNAIDGDQIIEESGVRIFVSPDAAFHLDDKILDAAFVGNEVQFTITEQK